MSIEERLRAALQRRAESVEARPDPDDLDQRAARSGRRRARALAGALALVLIVGPAAGFAIGRATSSDGDGDEPSVRADGGGAAPVPVPGGFGSEGQLSGPPGPIDFIGGGPFGPFGGPLERLFVRTTDDDVAIRAYRSDFGGGCPPGTPGCPPPQCFPIGHINAELSDEFAVGFGYGEIYGETDADLTVTAGYAGVPEDSPMAWAVAQVGPDVATVRAVLDGAEDEMEPVNGVAVLAAHVPGPRQPEAPTGPGPEILTAYAPSGVVEAIAADGSVIASHDLSTGSPMPPYDPDECEPEPSPPPTLPEPNGPPPADEEAARAEVMEAWRIGHDDSLPDEVRYAVVEGDIEYLVALEAEAKANYPTVIERVTMEVKEIRFLNETEAAVLYDIVIEDYSDFRGRIGRAKLVDGRWIVGLEGTCEDLLLAGVVCPPR